MWAVHDTDVTAPQSRHNIHVTSRDDLRGVGEWSGSTLYEAVRFADTDTDVDAVVVLDYRRTAVYLAPGTALRYEPPRGLGVAAPPALHVREPLLYDPDGPTATAIAPVTVSPTFDILVPAFDWNELDEQDTLPPIDRRGSRSPTSSGTGTPG